MEAMLLRIAGAFLFVVGFGVSITAASDVKWALTQPSADGAAAIRHAIDAFVLSAFGQIALSSIIAGAVLYGCGAIVAAVRFTHRPVMS